jgi:hypothetical protein
MDELSRDVLFGAAVLKLSFKLKDMLETPGFTFVYNGTLRELGVTDAQVDRFISKHKDALLAHIQQKSEAR